MKPEDNSRYVEVLGTRVHAIVAGDGPLVVLCGGLGSTWHDWVDVADALVRDGFTSVVVDRPGFGESEPLPTSRVPTVAVEARRILAVLDALGLAGPAVLVGHSMAGFYVEGFARLFPERTAGMLLLDTSVEKSPSAVLPRRVRIPLARAASRVASASGVQRLFAETARRVLTQATPPDGWPPERVDELRRIYRDPRFLEASSVEYAAYTDMAIELDELRRRTPTPDVPVVVAAAHTGVRTPWGAHWLRRQQRLARYLGGTYAIVSPSHHHIMIDQPERVVALVEGIARRSR